MPGVAGPVAEARDLRDMSSAAALAQLALRPAHRAVVSSWRQGVVARLLGVRQVTRD